MSLSGISNSSSADLRAQLEALKQEPTFCGLYLNGCFNAVRMVR